MVKQNYYLKRLDVATRKSWEMAFMAMDHRVIAGKRNNASWRSVHYMKQVQRFTRILNGEFVI